MSMTIGSWLENRAEKPPIEVGCGKSRVIKLSRMSTFVPVAR